MRTVFAFDSIIGFEVILSPDHLTRLVDTLFPTGWLLGWLLWILDAWIVTRLVRLEYTDYRREWERDGEPQGFFWVPPETGLWVSHRRYHALMKLFWLWIFKTPEWVKTDPTAYQLVLFHRFLVPLICLCLSGVFVLLLY